MKLRKKIKERMVDHLVKSIVHRRKLVLFIALLLCVISVVSMIIYIKLDLSMGAMAGKRVEEVNRFYDAMKKFNVSNMIQVITQPIPKNKEKLDRYYQEIDNLICEYLNNDEIIKPDVNAKDELISIYSEYFDKRRSKYFNERNIINITIELLKTLKNQERYKILNKFDELNEKEKILLQRHFDSYKKDDIRYIYKSFQNLSEDQINHILSILPNLEPDKKTKFVRSILNHMLLKDKIKFIKSFKGFIDDYNSKLLDEISIINENIESILNSFKNKSEIFAEDLKQSLMSDKKIEVAKKTFLFFDLTDEKTKSLKTTDDIIRGVLYSDEISLSENREMFMILISPKIDISIISNSRIFANIVDKELSIFKKEYEDDLVIKRTGTPITTYDEEKVMLEGFYFMLGSTIVLILLIFTIGLKRFAYPLFSMIPLLVGIILMFGFYAFVIKTVNIITIVNPVLLFGVGIDYAIHFGARYGEVRAELGNKASQEEVLKKTFNSIGFGLAIGALTTILAFLSLSNASIVSFVHLSIMASTGVFFAFVSMIYILPIIITWRESRHKKDHREFLNSNKFMKLGKFVHSKGGIVISIIIMIVALSSIFFITQLEVEIDKDALLPQNLESVEAGKEIAEVFNTSYIQTYYIVDGYDKMIEFIREINRRDDGVIVYQTINQKQTTTPRKAMRVFEKLGWDRNLETLDKYKKEYAQQTNLLGESNEKLAEYYEFIVRNYINWETGEYLITVSPAGNVWQKSLFFRHVDELEKLDKKMNTEGVGIIQIWHFLTTNMLSDLLISSIVAFVIILIILSFTTKSLRGTFICSFSLLVSIVSSLSIISILDIRLNFVNILAFPIVIGLGIDYSVHIYYRLLEEGNMNIINVIASTGKAVLLTTLTTQAAFGSISFSAHPGIAQLGQIALIGLLMCFLSSTFLIPTIVKILFKK